MVAPVLCPISLGLAVPPQRATQSETRPVPSGPGPPPAYQAPTRGPHREEAAPGLQVSSGQAEATASLSPPDPRHTLLMDTHALR